VRIPVSAGSRSASLKVIVIASLTLVLLIPIALIGNVIADRQDNASTAARDIQRMWGADQTVTGPLLQLPYERESQTVYGLSYIDEKSVYLIADELFIDAGVDTEVRYRGIHEIPVFSSTIRIRGHIDLAALDALGISRDQLRWADAELFLDVNDPMVLGKMPVVAVNAREVSFAAGGKGIEGIASKLSAAIGKVLDLPQAGTRLDFEISLALNGSGSLQFLPLAENAEVTLSSNWDSPSFTGYQLPLHREIRADGFEAMWQSTRIGRKLPSAWIGKEQVPFIAADSAFGARFIQTVGLYQLIERSVKYAVLIVGLTFIAYFLVEIVAGLRLHPLQYLLVGLANTLFYLLLLSLSEHVGFDLAYGLSASASTALIAAYSAAILQRRVRAFLMVGVLAALYAFLYLTLKAESYALLAGSLGLWFVLAVVMYLTRGINWYGDRDASICGADMK